MGDAKDDAIGGVGIDPDNPKPSCDREEDGPDRLEGVGRFGQPGNFANSVEGRSVCWKYKFFFWTFPQGPHLNVIDAVRSRFVGVSYRIVS